MMASWSDSTKAALNPEEAALLPALPRNRGTGGAALRAALRAAEAINEKQLSNAVAVAEMQTEEAKSACLANEGNTARPTSRAALHHVLRR